MFLSLCLDFLRLLTYTKVTITPTTKASRAKKINLVACLTFTSRQIHRQLHWQLQCNYVVLVNIFHVQISFSLFFHSFLILPLLCNFPLTSIKRWSDRKHAKNWMSLVTCIHRSFFLSFQQYPFHFYDSRLFCCRFQYTCDTFLSVIAQIL